MASNATQDPERMARSARLTAGCLTLFALPFLAVGGFATVELVRVLMTGDNATDSPPWFMAVFAVAFGGAAISMIAAARYGSRRLLAETRSRAARPGEPWLWREDWAQGRVRSPQRTGATVMGIFAVLWCAVSTPALFLVPDEVAAGNTAALLGLLFPIVGVGLVIAAVRLAIRSRKYAGTEIELAEVPIVPGNAFEGTLHTRFPDGAPEKLELALSCIRRTVRGTGKHRSVHERILWQEERQLEGWDIAVDFEQARVPFSFDIPDGAPSTTAAPRDRILWRLDARAETPGVDYAESFEVPVFVPGTDVDRKPASDEIEAAESRLARPDPDAPIVRPDRPTIVVQPADPVGTEFISRPNPGRASILPVTLFLAIWWGAVVLMLRLEAPVFFPVIFGVVGVLVLWFALDLAFGVTRTRVDDEGVTVHTSVLGIGSRRHFARANIERVDVRVGMSQGETTSQSAKAWHRVMIHTAGSGKVAAARHIPTRAEAEWVAAELRRAIGLE